MTFTPLPCRRLAVLIGAGSLLASASAQTAPTASPATVDQAVQLPQFLVQTDTDNGYRAKDTISGTLLNTPLIDTPSDVTVLTREFLNDLGVFTAAEAQTWLTSAYPNNAPVTDPRDFGANVTFRGLTSGANTRNYFLYGITAEEYIIDRIEGWRGPNGILYGSGPSGGSVNVVTKQAGFVPITTLDERVDTYGSLRTAIDVNRSFGDKFALRLNAIDQDRHSWIENNFDDLKAADLSATALPWQGAQFRAEGELGYRKSSINPYTNLDYSSSWDRVTTTSGALTASPAASTGLSRLTTNYIVASNSYTGTMNWLNYAQTTGTTLPIGAADNSVAANLPLLPRKSFSDMPAEAQVDNHYYSVQAFYQQQFGGGLVGELAFSADASPRVGPFQYFYATRQDVNKLLPNGQPNPEFGQYYSDSTVNNVYDNYNSERLFRAALAYPLKWGPINQTFSAIAARNLLTWRPSIEALGVDNNPADPKITDAANELVYRNYWNLNPNFNLPINSSGYDPAGNHYTWVQTRNTNEGTETNSFQGNTMGSYFNDSLTLIAGVRRTAYSGFISNIATTSANGMPASYSAIQFTSQVTTGDGGLVYFPIHWIGVYANYAGGFLPLSNNFPPLPGNPTVTATTSTSYDGGIRFRFFNDTIVGSIGYYTSAEKNEIQQISPSGINQIWADLGLPNQEITPTGGYLDTYDYDGHGVEVDVTANLSQNLRLITNLAFPHTQEKNALPGSHEYLAANLAQWQAGANNTALSTHAQIASDLATYENTVASQVNGRAINGQLAYTANVFVAYHFSTGWLKNLDVGGGANLYGSRLVGNQFNEPFAYMYDNPYQVATAFVKYSFKIGPFPVSFQVNVSNLFDYQKPIYSNVVVYSNTAYPGEYSYVQPRTALFSFKAAF